MIELVLIRVGDKYSEDYEAAAINGISRTLKQPHRIHIINKDTLEGWWVKLRLFQEDYPLPPVVYFFDIDVVFLRDLDDVIEALNSVDKPIVGIHDYYLDALNSSILRVDRRSEAAASVWDHWVRLRTNGIGRFPYHGDQDLIWNCAHTDIGFIPDELAPSYKVLAHLFPQAAHKKVTKIEDARLLVFHGNPNPHEVIERGLKWNREISENWSPGRDGTPRAPELH